MWYAPTLSGLPEARERWMFERFLAAGIAVAIPSYVLYAWLASSVRHFMHDMERAGIEIVNMILQSRQSNDIVGFKEGAQAVMEEKKRKAAGGGPR